MNKFTVAAAVLLIGLPPANATTVTVEGLLQPPAGSSTNEVDNLGLFGPAGAYLGGLPYSETISSDGTGGNNPFSVSLTVNGQTYISPGVWPFTESSYVTADQSYAQIQSSGCGLSSGPCVEADIMIDTDPGGWSSLYVRTYEGSTSLAGTIETPLPPAVLLFASGLLGLGWLGRRHGV